MRKIIGTGLSGMLGSCITEKLHGRYEFVDLSYDTGVDIRDQDLIREFISKIESNTVLHLAAKADVDACEEDKLEDSKTQRLKDSKPIDLTTINNWQEWKERNTAFAINVVGTLNIAHVCKELHKKLIYISTDFVFDGEKEEAYVEEDQPNPVNHYGMTKYWGEHVIRQVLDNYVIVRTAFPYGTHHEVKKDFVRLLRERFESNKPVTGVVDSLFTPTYGPDIADAIDYLITHEDSTGIFHVVGSESLSPYDGLVAIAGQFGYDTRIIGKVSAEEFYKGRAARPRNLKISNGKITKRGVQMRTFQEGLKLL